MDGNEKGEHSEGNNNKEILISILYFAGVRDATARTHDTLSISHREEQDKNNNKTGDDYIILHFKEETTDPEPEVRIQEEKEDKKDTVLDGGKVDKQQQNLSNFSLSAPASSSPPATTTSYLISLRFLIHSILLPKYPALHAYLSSACMVARNLDYVEEEYWRRRVTLDNNNLSNSCAIATTTTTITTTMIKDDDHHHHEIWLQDGDEIAIIPPVSGG